MGQRKILAMFAYCFYSYDLIDNLMNNGYGYAINAGYLDDDIMWAPSFSALQGMLKIV